jgi:hypothetical protein
MPVAGQDRLGDLITWAGVPSLAAWREVGGA